MRQEDHRDAGAPRLPRRRDRRRSAAAVRLLSDGRRAGSFERGIQKALQRILASPKFVLPHRARSGGRRARHGVSRSATSSWPRGCRSSCGAAFPTTSCSTLASAGQAAGRRPCSSSRCGACWPIRRPRRSSTNFAGQWLYLRNLQEHRSRTRTSFPTSTTTCGRRSSAKTELFFDSIVREDRSVLDLMTADYTFVNERLAQHYGIPNVYGSHFRRVTLTDDSARRGLLGKGARPDGDVARRPHLAGGARQVGAREPARRAAAAAAAERAAAQREPQRGGRVLTMRERMEEHRANPVCAQLPQADGSDRLRARELRRGRRVADARRRQRHRPGTPIDATGQLLDGTKVDGVVDAAAGAAAPAGDLRRHASPRS